MSKNSKSSAILDPQESSPGHTSPVQQPPRTCANVVKLGNQTSPTASVGPTRRPSCQPSPDPITAKIDRLVDIANNQQETLRITLGKILDILHQQQHHQIVLDTFVDVFTNQQENLSVTLSKILETLYQQQQHDQSVNDTLLNFITNQQVALSEISEMMHEMMHQHQQQQHQLVPKVIYLKEFDVSEEVTI
jgi:uncharacterized membrane-anchored protein YjiN (DUF445 family)